jgi:hypothetical protein
MKATRPAIWRALQAGMHPDQPYPLQAIYAVVNKGIVLDSEDPLRHRDGDLELKGPVRSITED